MNTSLKSALVAIALSAATVPAFAQDQLAASAGLSRSEAAGLSAAQIAAHFFNRGKSVADRQPIPGASVAMSARNEPGASLRTIAAEMSNRGESVADRQPVATPVPGHERRPQPARRVGGVRARRRR